MKSRTDAGLGKSKELAGAASVAEARRVRALVNAYRRPPGVLNWSAEYGEDATGEPAVWIWFHFKDEGGISQRKIEQLTDFVETVRSGLLNANLGRWPYVGFRNPPH